MSDDPIPEEVQEVVGKCKEYAEDLFDGTYYTSVTLWEDGDFSIEVRHGKGHKDEPYRHRAQIVQYRHFDGVIVYADKTRLIDRVRDEVHESRELERYWEGEEGSSDDD